MQWFTNCSFFRLVAVAWAFCIRQFNGKMTWGKSCFHRIHLHFYCINFFLIQDATVTSPDFFKREQFPTIWPGYCFDHGDNWDQEFFNLNFTVMSTTLASLINEETRLLFWNFFPPSLLNYFSICAFVSFLIFLSSSFIPTSLAIREMRVSNIGRFAVFSRLAKIWFQKIIFLRPGIFNLYLDHTYANKKYE